MNTWLYVFVPLVYFMLLTAFPVAGVIALIADYITLRRKEPPYTLEVTLRLMTQSTRLK